MQRFLFIDFISRAISEHLRIRALVTIDDVIADRFALIIAGASYVSIIFFRSDVITTTATGIRRCARLKNLLNEE